MIRRAEDLQVVVVGSTNFDLVVKAERLPREGETMLVSNLKFFPGGKGANQAVAAARMGAKTSFIGAVGNDIIGDFLLQGLVANGIDTTCVRRDPVRATGSAFIMLFPNGNNCITVDPAANFSLTPADIERAKDVIERADALSTVLEIPLEVVEAALRLGRKAGKLTVLDAGPPRYCPMEILTLADVVSPNETELAHLTGEEVRGWINRNAIVAVGEKHDESAPGGARWVSPDAGGVNPVRHQPLKQEVSDDVVAHCTNKRGPGAHSRHGHRLVRSLAARKELEI